jgi:tRNA (cmo5U34)-methyltransferase
MSAQFHMDPETYLEEIRREVPRYDELQEATIDAIPFAPGRVLELGVGTGETAHRLIARFPDTEMVGLDSQPEMVFKAREAGIEVRLARMEDPLPDGPWDLVLSVLSMHHLDEDGKRDLFRRVREQSRALVMGDVVTCDPQVTAARARRRPALARRGHGGVVRRRGRLAGRRPGGDPRGLRVGEQRRPTSTAGDLAGFGRHASISRQFMERARTGAGSLEGCPSAALAC